MNESLKPTDLARQSLLHYLKHKKNLPCPETLPSLLAQASACFVTLKKGDALRGCVGTLDPEKDTLAEEIIRNAVRSAFNDPRFEAVTLKELNDINFSVDVVRPSKKIESTKELDPACYGLIIQSGKKRGVLLPGIDGIETVEEQFRICLKKGEISKDDPQEWFRFEVLRFHE